MIMIPTLYVKLHTKSPVFIPSIQRKYSQGREVLFFFFFFNCDCFQNPWILCELLHNWLSFPSSKLSSGGRTAGRSTSCFTPANSPTTPWCTWVLQAAVRFSCEVEVNLHPAQIPSSPPAPPGSYPSQTEWVERSSVPEETQRQILFSPRRAAAECRWGEREVRQREGSKEFRFKGGFTQEYLYLPVLQRWWTASWNSFSVQNQTWLILWASLIWKWISANRYCIF